MNEVGNMRGKRKKKEEEEEEKERNIVR